MHKKQGYIYVGLDLHKLTHTGVIINCWNERLGEITFNNTPNDFIKLIFEVTKHNKENLTPVYGLENAGSYGRKLACYLLEKGYIVGFEMSNEIIIKLGMIGIPINFHILSFGTVEE